MTRSPTVQEAFASGVPAVTSRLEQTVDIVETVGRTVEVDDIEGYAAAIESVLDENDNGNSSRAGRQLVVDKHE